MRRSIASHLAGKTRRTATTSEAHHPWRSIIYSYLQTTKPSHEPTTTTTNADAAFPQLFKACAHLQSITHGTSLHADALKLGFASHASTVNSILNFYIKCGMMRSASILFDSIAHKDSVSWNSFIHGLLSRGDSEIGLSLFLEARVFDFTPNVATLVLVLQACWRLQAIAEGLVMHCLLVRSGLFRDVSIQNALMSLYAKSCDLASAQKVFDEMLERDVISWSVLVSAYAQAGAYAGAMQLFWRMFMEDAIDVDGLAVVSVLQACGGIGDVKHGRLIHGYSIRRGFYTDLFVGNSLIDMYSKCGNVDSAFMIFDLMLEKNIVSWNSMLSGLVHNGKYLEALMLFGSVLEAGIQWDEVTLVSLLQSCKRVGQAIWCKCIHAVIIRRMLDPNEMAFNSLMDSYAKFDRMELAVRLFDSMKRRNLISWSTMIAGFAHCGQPNEAIAFFQEMLLAEERPNAVTMLSLLEACAISADAKLSKSAHGIAIRNGLASDIAVSTMLINTYGKCGDVKLSKRAFDVMPDRNILSWNSMIGALGMNGCAREALAALHEMDSGSVRPNGVTMLSVLSGCSHGGLVQEGLSCFKSMLEDPMLQPGPEHYSCIIDMLGRFGDVQSASEVIRRMPRGLMAGGAAWGALLSACKRVGNCELGREAALHVMELEPLNPAGYLLTSNMFAKNGLIGDTVSARSLMRERGATAGSGYSLVHVGKVAHRFVAWDGRHPQSAEIYGIVELLHACMVAESERDVEGWLSFAWNIMDENQGQRYFN